MDNDLRNKIIQIMSGSELAEQRQIQQLLLETAEETRNSTAGKTRKSAVLYLYVPEGTQYQCLDCVFFQPEEQRCFVHGKGDVIRSIGTCGVYAFGNSSFDGQGQLGVFTKEETGYEENVDGFSCKRCEYFGGVEVRKCKKVDENSPGDTPGEIHENACCNAWDKK